MGNGHVAIQYEYPEIWSTPTAWADPDGTGCRTTRKPTSGGVVVRSNHMSRLWSPTRACIVLSSGDAECYALTNGIAAVIGIKPPWIDMCVLVNECEWITAHMDSMVPNGMAVI